MGLSVANSPALGSVFTTAQPITVFDTRTNSILVITTSSLIPSSAVPSLTTISEASTSTSTTSVPSSVSTQPSTLTSAITATLLQTPSLPPQTALLRSTAIGLGVGISFGAFGFAALGACITYYCLRIRKRTRGSTAKSGQALGRPTIVQEECTQYELDAERRRSRNELDGEHWKRELPASPVARTGHESVAETG